MPSSNVGRVTSSLPLRPIPSFEGSNSRSAGRPRRRHRSDRQIWSDQAHRRPSPGCSCCARRRQPAHLRANSRRHSARHTQRARATSSRRSSTVRRGLGPGSPGSGSTAIALSCSRGRREVSRSVDSGCRGYGPAPPWTGDRAELTGPNQRRRISGAESAVPVRLHPVNAPGRFRDVAGSQHSEIEHRSTVRFGRPACVSNTQPR